MPTMVMTRSGSGSSNTAQAFQVPNELQGRFHDSQVGKS
jgi:hypothetical protein